MHIVVVCELLNFINDDYLSVSYDHACSSATGNEVGGPWVPPPTSPRLSQSSIQTHDPVLVSFYCILVALMKVVFNNNVVIC